MALAKNNLIVSRHLEADKTFYRFAIKGSEIFVRETIK
jgi:hypothetical protein